MTNPTEGPTIPGAGKRNNATKPFLKRVAKNKTRRKTAKQSRRRNRK